MIRDSRSAISNRSEYQVTTLTLPSLRVLQALSLTRATSSKVLRKKSDGDYQELAKKGLIREVDIDIDGLKEKAWMLTPLGKQVLDASGGVESRKQAKDGKRQISTLVPWFGGARLTGAEVGALLRGCAFVAVPFCGGLAELPHIEASTIVCNDLHGGIINLATVLSDETLGPWLIRRLRRKVFHPRVLAKAQERYTKWAEEHDEEPDIEAAEDFFVCAWMGRSGKAGTDGEAKGGLALRWDAGGGDSALRFSNAVMGLRGWRRILSRCSFACLDWQEFMDKVKDKKGHGVYADPPWPMTGDSYSHRFTDKDHEVLAELLGSYKLSTVVVRNLDCDLIRRLYPEPEWKWRTFAGRNQGNNSVSEALIWRKL